MSNTRVSFCAGLFAVVLMLTLTLPVRSASIADHLQGRWVADMTGDGKAFSFIFNFKVSGEVLTGTIELSTRDDVFPIKDGKIKGNDVSFNGFGTWTGTLEGNELRLTRGLDYGKKQHMVARRQGADRK